MTPLFDAHCHLQDPRLMPDIDTVIRRAHHQGVIDMVCCATGKTDWDSTQNLAHQYSSVIPAYGVHPWYAQTCSKHWIDELNRLIENDRSAAVGEIGLDYGVPDVDKIRQQTVFVEQIRLAQSRNRPVIIHCRKAFEPLLEILRSHSGHPVKGVIHSYSGSAELVPVFEKLGLYLSFSSAVMDHKNKRAKNALQAVSCDRLLIETDSPDLKPAAIRTSCNSPEVLPLIAQSCAVHRHTTFKQIATITRANATRLFKRETDEPIQQT